MLKNASNNTEAMPALDEEPSTAGEDFHIAFGPLSADALSGEDLLTAHLRVTAPDRLMEGFELQEGSCKLYLELDPKTPIQAMIAVLAIDNFNASFSSFADANLRNIPPDVRDKNLRNGVKTSMASAALLEKYHEMRYGSQKRVTVGRVNVEPGGQAIVGHVESGRPRRSETRGASKTSRPRKRKRSGGSGKILKA